MYVRCVNVFGIGILQEKINPHKFSYTKNETEQIKRQPKKKSSAVSVVAPPAWQSAS